MRALVGVLLLVGAAVAGPLDLGSFQVSGSGTFGCDVLDSTTGFTVFFSGSNGSYTITAGSSGLGGAFGPSANNLQYKCIGASLGDNVVLADTNPPSMQAIEPFNAAFTPAGSPQSISGPAEFQIGNGAGYLDIFDQASAQPGNPATLIATATLIGYVTVKSAQTTAPIYPAWNGTYSITAAAPAGTAAPEPGSAAMLVMVALWPAAGAAAYSARRRIRSRSGKPASKFSPSSQS